MSGTCPAPLRLQTFLSKSICSSHIEYLHLYLQYSVFCVCSTQYFSICAMCRVYLLFTRLTLTSALWRMLGIQGGGHFSKHASKHNIFRRDAIVDRSERLLGKCRVLTRRNSAGLRIFHWGALVPSQYGCISQLHTIQDDIFSNILASKIPPGLSIQGLRLPFFGGMPPSAVSQASSYKT